MLIQFDVALRNALSIFISNLWHYLSRLVHKVVLDEPLANEFLGELALGFTLGQFFLIAISIEVAARVWRVDFINEIHLTIALAKFVLRVDKNQTALSSNLLSTGKNLTGVVLHDCIVFCRYDALCDNLFFRDVHVVTFIGLCRRGDDRLGETLVLFHAIGQFHTAEFTAAVLVLTPGRACENRTDNHLYTEALTFKTNRHHGVGSGQLPVGTDVCCGIQELCGNLVQHLSLERDTLRQYYVECRDTVSGYHHHQIVIDVVHIAYLTMIHALLSLELKVRLC